jgi:hypothetical protein
MIGKALAKIAGGKNWILHGGTYEGLVWNDESSMPTKEEVETEAARLQAEYDATEYQRKRAAEYPPMSDYLDGVVKGDQAQIDAYVAACLAVKAKYPKEQA